MAAAVVAAVERGLVRQLDDYELPDVAVTTRVATAHAALRRSWTRAVGADRAYLWSTMDRWPHLHVWLVPWWDDGDLRGPSCLVEALGGAGCTADEAGAAADRIRAVLAEEGQTRCGQLWGRGSRR